ncbi:MAG UNVERIFIED_CONTAM: pyridoxal-dependent decarboxylase [Anaerolineae bacterium]|jgi:glutamate/tyrosine decarboxylase-like PLP-dependent enzyme
MDKSDDMVNYWDYGLQLTRGFRALKLWMSFKVFGVEAFRDAVDWGIEQAEFVQQLLEANPRWEIITAAQIGIINFRYVPEGLVTSEFFEHASTTDCG